MRRIRDYFLTEVLSQAFGVRTWRDGIGFDLKASKPEDALVLYVTVKLQGFTALALREGRSKNFSRSTTFDTNLIFSSTVDWY